METTGLLKFLRKLPAGWFYENAVDFRGIPFAALRFNYDSGEFLRVRKWNDAKEWTCVLFNADGSGSHGNSFSSFKKLVASLKG